MSNPNIQVTPTVLGLDVKYVPGSVDLGVDAPLSPPHLVRQSGNDNRDSGMSPLGRDTEKKAPS